jgi:pyruvate/2-oxoglutarate dehydrogenase complex dihydrolipoamide dehydrogenase (E3) component/uncharacterized membrane protein YdjX (TVP38/TMEM64 family)
MSAAPASRRSPVRLALALAVVAAIALAAIALHGAISPQAAFAEVAAWRAFADAHELAAAAAYVAFYAAFSALSLPGAWIVSVAGGALFGGWLGIPLVSLSSTAGATLAMLLSRYLARDFVAARFPDFVARVDRGVARDGLRWLFAARLTPVIPFFAINLAVGLTRMPAGAFALVTMLGSFPFAALYALAGAEVATVTRPSDLFSAPLIAALLALAAAPFAAKGFGQWRETRRRLGRWARPRRFDYNLIVIGAGSAGLVAAYVAAAARARVALIEAGEMGGECLNAGCVPSKALIRSAKLAHEGAHAAAFGLSGRLAPDFAAVMARVRQVIAQVAPHDSAERYRSLGVEVIAARARVVDPWTVEAAGRRLTTRRIVVATGAEPLLPPIPGLAEADPLTSETLWRLTELPPRLLVLGGGAVGCELAQAFARLGSQVTLVEAAPRLLPREDEDVSAAMRAALAADGVTVIEGVAAAAFTPGAATLADGRNLGFDRVLVAVGRRPRVRGFGLEELGLVEDGRLVVDERLRTRIPTIFAAGDVIGQLQFTHAAGRYGASAAINALLAPLRLAKATLPAFPSVIYTDPEIARLGLSEREAREQGVAYEVTRYDLSRLDRAIADGAAQGFVKVLTPPGRDRILGATLVGARAGDMLSEFTLAMRHGLGLKAILATIHPYPGWSDAARATAAEWRQAHAPQRALRLAERLFAGLRG